eukprot:1349836-Pleurochrysis_carterae.AAC.4
MMLEKRTSAGLAQQEAGSGKLTKKRAKRAVKATKRVCIGALLLAKHYSDLKLIGMDDLWDQLKKHKLAGQDWLRPLPSHPPDIRALAANVAPRSQRGCKRPQGRQL